MWTAACLDNIKDGTCEIFSGSIPFPAPESTDGSLCKEIWFNTSDYAQSPALRVELQHLQRPLQLIWEKSFEWDINSAQMIWKTQLTFNRVMKCNNTNKCASGHSENKPSLARWKLLKCDNRQPSPCARLYGGWKVKDVAFTFQRWIHKE